MTSTVLLVALVIAAMPCALLAVRGPFRTMFPANPPAYTRRTGVDPGQPLFLTPYIEKGQIKEGQALSLVGMLNGTNVRSYSGYLTVNKEYNSNMFFWFFPSQSGPDTAPLLLWLQGGPGGTSMFGLFTEHGPFSVTKDLKLLPRKYSWTTKYSVLYIDNPVGTGFSFTGSDQGYVRNESAVAKDLYSAIVQFFQLFPEYQKNDFYATGESYAGKYVPAISYMIHVENPEAKIKINFKGMAIGDGFTSPEKLIPGYGSFMFQTGQADFLQKTMIDRMTADIVALIRAKAWLAADKLIDSLINSDTGSYFKNITGCTDYYNYMRTSIPADQDYFTNYLALPEVRKAIHVGNLTFNNGDKVSEFLQEDFLQSVEELVIILANADYKILFYNGQLDVIVAAPLTEVFLDQLDWKGLPDYIVAERKIWKVPGENEVAGYAKKVMNFQQVVVRGAGHILPYDQPHRGFDMIDRFITGRPFDH